MTRRRYVATFQNSSVLGQLAYVATCVDSARRKPAGKWWSVMEPIG